MHEHLHQRLQPLHHQNRCLSRCRRQQQEQPAVASRPLWRRRHCHRCCYLHRRQHSQMDQMDEQPRRHRLLQLQRLQLQLLQPWLSCAASVHELAGALQQIASSQTELLLHRTLLVQSEQQSCFRLHCLNSN